MQPSSAQSTQKDLTASQDADKVTILMESLMRRENFVKVLEAALEESQQECQSTKKDLFNAKRRIAELEIDVNTKEQELSYLRDNLSVMKNHIFGNPNPNVLLGLPAAQSDDSDPIPLGSL